MSENKDNIEKKIPKKRGRKPKIKIPVIENPQFTTNVPNKMIIKLNNKNLNEINNDIKPFSDNCEKSEIENNSSNNSELCWNCCHKFNDIKMGIPLKISKGVFYTYGDFCSLECGSRYAYENLDNKWEVLSLINLYNFKINNTKEKINIPQSRLNLKVFGGNLTIEEYRKNFKKKSLYDLVIPPFIPVNHEMENFEVKNNSLSELRLYRNKSLPKENKITNVLDKI